MSAQSLILPLDIRLRTIEAQLFGASSSSSSTSQQYKKESSKSIISQIRESEEVFERLSSESEGLKRLFEGYEQYLPLLNTTTTNQSSSEDQEDINKDGKQQIQESDLLPDKLKLTMILESQQDLIEAERDLREIELLKQKNVEGSGNLEDLLPLKSNLIQSIEKTQKDSNELMKVKNEIGDLLNRYNEFTSTSSELFIDLHHNLQYLEDRVSKLERKKRKEIEGRF